MKFCKAFLDADMMPNFCHQSSFISTQLMRQYHYDQSFLIAADTDFFYKLHQNNNKFFFVDLTISIDDSNGISSNNRVRVYKEVSRIKKTKLSKLKMLKYAIEDAMPKWLMKKLMILTWYFD